MTLKQHITHKLHLELLGIGSSKDQKLKSVLMETVKELKMDVTLKEVKDINKLLKYDISGIPALVYNERVVFQKNVPEKEELKLILRILAIKGKTEWDINQIIVPTDFTNVSENALKYAVNFAALIGANVKVIHINNPAYIPSSEGGVLIETNNAFKLSLLQKIEETYKSGKVKVETALLSGYAVEILKDISREEETDLIIMGTTGEKVFLEQLFGSISSDVARRAACPVLIIPPTAEHTQLSEIVYASGNNPLEISAIYRAIGFAQLFQSNLLLAHINEEDYYSYHVRKFNLDQLIEKQAIKLDMITVESTNIAKGLNDFIKEQGTDLLIMSTHHRNFFEQLFHKSVTCEMMLQSPVPLLILHN